MIRNDSLQPLHLEGFDEIQTGHWTLENDGHSGEPPPPLLPPFPFLSFPFVCFDVASSLLLVVLQVGSGMAVSGGGLPGVYHTVQLHFHWGGPASNGSEHTVDGHRYPMEVQFGQ